MWTLYNNRLSKPLSHPRIGLWYTDDFNEAEEMLEACKQVVRNDGMNLEDDFIIKEIDEDYLDQFHCSFPSSSQ